MRSEKLRIDHKDLLVPCLKAVKTSLSEYTFPNLFRANHDYEVMIDKEIFIRGRSYDGRTYLMPTSDVRRIDTVYLKDLLRDIEFLFPIPDEWRHSIPLSST